MQYMLFAITPVFMGVLVFAAMQLLKKYSAAVDALPASKKRVAVMALTAAVVLVSKWLHIVSPCSLTSPDTCLASLDKDAVTLILTAAVAFATHALKPGAEATS